MSSPARARLTPEEYLEIERKADLKSEYLSGEMFALAGTTAAHALIVTNVISALHDQVKDRPCTVYSTDLRVRVSESGLYTYPEVFVICGPPEFIDAHLDTVTNPKLIVEVLSESTRDYDRGRKFEQYRSLGSFEEYVLIAQERCHVEHFVRRPDGSWVLTETSDADGELELSSIGCALKVSEIYDKVQLPRAAR